MLLGLPSLKEGKPADSGKWVLCVKMPCSVVAEHARAARGDVYWSARDL